MILVARGKGTEARVLRELGLAREGILISWYPVPGSRVPCTRPLGARFGGIVVTSTKSVDFGYRYVGPVASGTEIVDFGYPK